MKQIKQVSECAFTSLNNEQFKNERIKRNYGKWTSQQLVNTFSLAIMKTKWRLYLSLWSRQIRSFGTFSLFEICFFKFSIVSVFVTASSNWPPVVGVTEMVMLGGQPHPVEHGQVSFAISIFYITYTSTLKKGVNSRF